MTLRRAAALIWSALKWAGEEAWEKINIPAKWAEIKTLGKKHGLRFVVFAVVWELIEDGLFPFLSWYFGVPELIPVFLVLHFEPVVYPVAFYAFRTYDRLQGKEPWDPDRSAASKGYRTAAKVLIYRLVSLAAFGAILSHLSISMWVLALYTLMMVVFGAVHERVWHDSNYGINPDTDAVSPVRNLLKTCTYRATSTTIMSGVMLGVLGSVPWVMVLGYQATMFVAYWLLETLWSRTTWGIVATAES